MTGGDIAGLIAAGVFAVLVGLLAVPICQARARASTRRRTPSASITDDVTPLLDEATTTVSETNTPARPRRRHHRRASRRSTGNVSALVALFAATVGRPLIKIAGFSAGVRAAIGRAARPAGGAAARTS